MVIREDDIQFVESDERGDEVGKPLQPVQIPQPITALPKEESLSADDDGPSGTVGNPVAPPQQTKDISQRREGARQYLLVALMMILGAITLYPLWMLRENLSYPETVKDIWGVLLPPVFGLVGSAVTFYYTLSERSSDRNKK